MPENRTNDLMFTGAAGAITLIGGVALILINLFGVDIFTALGIGFLAEVVAVFIGLITIFIGAIFFVDKIWLK